ncbi:hypothetical protein [Pseudoduganella aquatica]|uniref:Uncharacterized protein n=1 Tax=Pseudoduganella aquatica TaxID=2660641 RepID=A0A7X4KNX9_9BURK|nr:hypothetical protein [Pseudoduganella aquatica]MYN09703.1 hypothetical protein [Pseudoduganella aquatica]
MSSIRNAPLEIRDFFTEYNDAISGDSNTDPLGLTVIWASLGQRIFSNRISSISYDVRSYTLNLFHHHMVRALADDAAIVQHYAALDLPNSMDSLAFKNSCLIHFENLFTYAMAQHGSAAQASGVLGISKARRKLREAGGAALGFGHSQAHQILRRQLLLGVSGRYKTPMIEMRFFDRAYRYQLPKQPAGLWPAADALIRRVPELSRLKSKLLAHFLQFLQHGPQLSMPLDSVDPELKLAYIGAFRTPAHVGSYARSFWLEATGLSGGIAGAVLAQLDGAERAGTAPSPPQPPRTVLAQARAAMEQASPAAPGSAELEAALLPIRHIEQVEPFIADLDLLFQLALRRPHSSMAQIEEDWTRYGRNSGTLPAQAAALQASPQLMPSLPGTAQRRLRKLLEIAACPDLETQLAHLLRYHGGIMQQRGQGAWLNVNAAGAYAVSVRTSKPPAAEKRPPGAWIHGYYIGEFKQFAQGLRGGAA